MRYSVLCSSSSGNCVFLEVNNKKYLLDCGLSLKQIRDRLASLNLDLNYLDGIFITHEHTDHISGLASVCTKLKTTIYMSKVTYRGLPESLREKVSPIMFNFITPEEEFELDGLKVLPFKTNHDARDPVGYRFIYDDKVLVYLTDTGYFIKRDDLVNADSYILECNHEPEMLKLSNRPWPLINRILSKNGHLSNQDSAILFNELRGEKTKSLVLFHLSNECNTKELALLAYESYFKKINSSLDDLYLVVSDRLNPIDLIEV